MPTPRRKASVRHRWRLKARTGWLPLDVVRSSDNPDETLLEFLRSTFDAAATLGDWDLSEYRRRHFPHGE
jgi:hypothetical protein